MCNNLNFIKEECVKEYGEKIIINKAGYYVSEPGRGDIVIFTPKTSAEKYFIKRIIGLPGETVEILNGEVYITNDHNPTGTKLEETYLNESNKGHTQSFSSGNKVFHVPEGEYFVLGDNRGASTDSRTCFNNPYGGGCKNGTEEAFVPKSSLEGRAWVAWWPIPNMRTIDKIEYPELLPQKSSLEAK